ncbi:MAG TPA: hypothetical protein VLE43_06160 [Candidatus Saccharimonadia bacterium]|nr:hypothetical protein [Candidatus Saccharimonadia bacterium]
MEQSSKVVVSIVLCVVLSAAAAWLITTHLAPAQQSFLLVLLSCVAVAGISAAVLSMVGAPTAALLCGVLIAAAIVTMPVLKRFELPKVVPFTAAAAFIIGFISSRVVYKET